RSTTIKSRVTKISLALSSRRDNHLLAATAKMAILIVAEFSSSLSRYSRQWNSDGVLLSGRHGARGGVAVSGRRASWDRVWTPPVSEQGAVTA
ncbi:MAG: hypothetical protein NTV56_14640, partial [Alphaproteobacteria bacterium]|nr:hypothetical protein [Alphaproteobacteria bacterium]